MFSSVIASGRSHQFTSVVRLPTCTVTITEDRAHATTPLTSPAWPLLLIPGDGSAWTSSGKGLNEHSILLVQAFLLYRP